MRRTGRLLMSGAVCAMVLVGCTPEAAPAPTPSPTAAPVFASEEEAYAAAETAYRAYRAVFTEITASGGSNPEPLRPFVTDDIFDRESQGFRVYEENRWRTVGKPAISFARQWVDLSGGTVRLYVCENLASLDVIDESGRSVVDPDRNDHSPLEVEFSTSDSLRISRLESWTGDVPCSF